MENKEIIITFLQILDCEEFGLVRYKNGIWGVVDYQGAYLGDIDNDTFETITEIVDRMSIYHNDYFTRDIEEVFNITEYKDYNDLVLKCKQQKELYKEYKWEVDCIDFITKCPDYEICNTPLEKIKDLLNYEQYDEDFIKED